MKKFIQSALLIIALAFLWISPIYAGGGIAHMLVAQETIALLPDATLRQLLENNKEAYLVGAYYPDSGYVAGNHYGEDSHWDPFIYAFADYIKDTYPNPEQSHPKLVAFLFGCAVHRVSDEIMHWTFYPVAAKQDLHSDNWEDFHTYGDVGLDLIINVDKNQWGAHPLSWWVPVADLVHVYHRMGKDAYTANEIINGNIVTYLANYSERLIAAPAYPILKWKIAWAANHYYDWPEGGLLMDEKKTAEYLMALWQRLKGPKPPHSPNMISVNANTNLSRPTYSHQKNTLHAFSEKMIETQALKASVRTNNDGSIEIHSPVAQSIVQWQSAIDELFPNTKSRKNTAQ